MTDSNMTGKTARFILIGEYHYTGEIIEEQELSFKILDKFHKIVLIPKNQIRIMEEIK